MKQCKEEQLVDKDPISFETEYYAKDKGDINSDVMVCMRMYYTHILSSLVPRPLSDFISQLFFFTAAR